MKVVAALITLLFSINQFIEGQDTLNAQSTKPLISPHKFSSTVSVQDTASSALETQVCKSCHVPNKNNPVVTDSSSAYIKESKSFIRSFENYLFNYCPMCSRVNAPDGISTSCLSCHDGSVAPGQLARQPGITLGEGTINLFNSHPISFVYSNSPDGELWPVTHVYNGTNTIQDLLDENNEVQCTSCHNMHDNEYEYFLKMSIENSALCLICHKR